MGTDTAEFLEVRNNGAAPVQLEDFTLRLVNGRRADRHGGSARASRAARRHVVRVRGTVGEFNGNTQLGSVANLAVCASEGSATATDVALPVSSLGDWEPREGMLVTIPQPLSIGEYFNFDRFNETVLTVGRQYQAKIVAAITKLDADVVGLIEIEKTTRRSRTS